MTNSRGNVYAVRALARQCDQNNTSRRVGARAVRVDSFVDRCINIYSEQRGRASERVLLFLLFLLYIYLNILFNNMCT